MSVTGSASSTNNLNVLKGKISSLSPYALDKTLSVAGSAADAKAVGDALEKKVGFTDIVDNLNTNDPDLPLSAKQGVVIKKSFEELKVNTEEEISQMEQSYKELAESVKGATNSATNAQNAAESAQQVAESKLSPDGSVPMTSDFDMGSNRIVNLFTPMSDTDAATKEYVDSRRFTTVVSLKVGSWATYTGSAPYYQTVTVNGVTSDESLSDVVASPAPAENNYKAYVESGVRLIAQHENEIEFICDEKPEIGLSVNVAVYVRTVNTASAFGVLNLNNDAGAAVMCAVGDENYGVGNATVNSGASGSNYDFTVL